MKKQCVIIMLLCSILLGCSKAENVSDVIVISYINEDNSKIGYDAAGNNYTIISGNYYHNYTTNLIQEPVLLYTDVHLKYKIIPDIPNRYLSTATDSFAYITQLKENGYSIDFIKATPHLCEVKATKGDRLLKIYVEQKYLRVYSNTGKLIDKEDPTYVK